MAHKYVSFISDNHLMACIKNLHQAYLKAKNNISKKSFYANKIDTFKLTFDAHFNNIKEEDLIQSEILRQIDKSINNSIGTFHEQILGGIKGYQMGKLSGFDIKAEDNSLFAIFGTSETPATITDGVFDKLANTARLYPKAKFYFVLLDEQSDLHEKWIIGTEELFISQKRVFKISLKEFYSVISGTENALDELQNNLPKALEAFNTIQQPS